MDGFTPIFFSVSSRRRDIQYDNRDSDSNDTFLDKLSQIKSSSFCAFPQSYAFLMIQHLLFMMILFCFYKKLSQKIKYLLHIFFFFAAAVIQYIHVCVCVCVCVCIFFFTC